MLFPSGSTFSLPGPSFFPPQAPQVPQQLISQQQRQQLQLAVGNSQMISMPIIPGGDMAAARNLQTQRWLQSHSNLYDLYNNLQSRAPSAISGVSGRSSVSGINDDASTISQMTDWSANSSSISSNLGLLVSAASVENVDPIRKHLQSLCDFNCDGDEQLIYEWAKAVYKFASKQKECLPPNAVHSLSRRIIAYLSGGEIFTINDESCFALFQGFLHLSKMSAFKKIENELAYGIFATYRNLMRREFARVVYALPLLFGALVASAEARQEAGRDETFINHIIRVMDTNDKVSVLRSALSITRYFLRSKVDFKDMRSMFIALIKLAEPKKHGIVRQLALDIIEMFAKRKPEVVHHFFNINGIEHLLGYVAIENTREVTPNLKYAQSALKILRELSCDKAMASLNLGNVVEQLIPLLFFMQEKAYRKDRQTQGSVFKITVLAFDFIRNTLARNINAMAVVSEHSKLFEGIEKYLHEAFTYLSQIKKCDDRQKLHDPKVAQESTDVTAYSIFDNALTILTCLNKKSNPQRRAASELIKNSAVLQEVIQFIADHDSEDPMPYNRFINCWHNMLQCGVMPAQQNLSSVAHCLLRFIRTWTEQKINGVSMSESEYTPQKAFEVLAMIVESTNHYENITHFFKGEINLFALVGRVCERECVAILNLIDVIFTKDYSLQLAWADIDTSIIRLCEASTKPEIAELGRKIQQKLKRDDYTMTDVLMTSFGNFG